MVRRDHRRAGRIEETLEREVAGREAGARERTHLRRVVPRAQGLPATFATKGERGSARALVRDAPEEHGIDSRHVARERDHVGSASIARCVEERDEPGKRPMLRGRIGEHGHTVELDPRDRPYDHGLELRLTRDPDRPGHERLASGRPEERLREALHAARTTADEDTAEHVATLALR